MPSTTTTRHSSQPDVYIGAGRVGDVVVHLMKTVKGKAGRARLSCSSSAWSEKRSVLLGRNWVDQIHGAVGGIVELWAISSMSPGTRSAADRQY